MSKLLLSTSMVVALMAINPALHAEDPKPMPVEPVMEPITVDQKQETGTAKDEAELVPQELLENTDQSVSEEDMKVLDKDQIGFSKDAEAAFQELRKDHNDLDEAIKSAQEAANPEDQQAEFKKVEEHLAEVEKSANNLADELKKEGDKNDEGVAESLISDSKAENDAQVAIAEDTKDLESVDETQTQADDVAVDAALSPADDIKIADKMKDKVDEIKESVDAATEIQQGLEDAGKVVERVS